MEHLVRLAYRSAGSGDRRRPHQLVEVRVLAGELQVVIPARPDVVSDMIVDDGCDGALGLQEGGPAEVDHRGEQPVLVAEVVVQGRRGNASCIADGSRGDVCVGGLGQEASGRLEDAGSDGHGARLADLYSASQDIYISSL